MLIVQKLSGVAVLLLALHFVHAMHFFFLNASRDSPYFWPGMVAGAVVWIFSFIGGCLLLRRSAESRSG
jgi:succinate dehydrogenase/fumarate reductase cytochrome b subunit